MYKTFFVSRFLKLVQKGGNMLPHPVTLFALIVSFIQQYDKKVGIVTVVSIMLSYSIVSFFGWTVLLIIWMLIGLPIGPRDSLHYVG